VGKRAFGEKKEHLKMKQLQKTGIFWRWWWISENKGYAGGFFTT